MGAVRMNHSIPISSRIDSPRGPLWGLAHEPSSHRNHRAILNLGILMLIVGSGEPHHVCGYPDASACSVCIGSPF